MPRRGGVTPALVTTAMAGSTTGKSKEGVGRARVTHQRTHAPSVTARQISSAKTILSPSSLSSRFRAPTRRRQNLATITHRLIVSNQTSPPTPLLPPPAKQPNCPSQKRHKNNLLTPPPQKQLHHPPPPPLPHPPLPHP